MEHSGERGGGNGDGRGAVAGDGARREEVVDSAHGVGGESGLVTVRGDQDEMVERFPSVHQGILI